MLKDRKKITDLIVISTFYLLIVIFAKPILTLPYIITVLLWFYVPSLYLGFRRRKNWKEISIATLLIGTFVMGADIFLSFNEAWVTAPGVKQNLLGIRGWSLEEIFWIYGTILYPIVFYEHFIDKQNKFRVPDRLKCLAVTGILSFIVLFFAILYFPEKMQTSYAYAKAGFIGVVPITLILFSKHSHLLKKFLPVGLYFFFFNLVMEIQAVRLNMWWFPDTKNYLGTLTIFGAAFPLEELIFWMILYTGVALAYYEVFVDDDK